MLWLTRCGPRLQELSLDEMADSGMELLARHCPNLETVNCTTGVQCVRDSTCRFTQALALCGVV